MYSTTEIKISKTALLHFVMLTFVLELLKKSAMRSILLTKDLGVGFMVVFLNHVFTWSVHKLRHKRHCQTQKQF